jgi:hypothetical protein
MSVQTFKRRRAGSRGTRRAVRQFSRKVLVRTHTGHRAALAGRIFSGQHKQHNRPNLLRGNHQSSNPRRHSEKATAAAIHRTTQGTTTNRHQRHPRRKRQNADGTPGQAQTSFSSTPTYHRGTAKRTKRQPPKSTRTGAPARRREHGEADAQQSHQFAFVTTCPHDVTDTTSNFKFKGNVATEGGIEKIKYYTFLFCLWRGEYCGDLYGG